MNFQQTRQYYETPVIATCAAQSVEYRAENTLLPTGDAITRFCLARLQFGEMAEPVVGCTSLANERAVFSVEYFGPKGIGPAEAQTFMQEILCELGKLGGIISVNGPDFTPLDDRPYFFARASFGIQVPNLDPPIPIIQGDFAPLVGNTQDTLGYPENVVNPCGAVDRDETTYASAVNDENTLHIISPTPFVTAKISVEAKVQPNHYVTVNGTDETQADADGLVIIGVDDDITNIRVSDEPAATAVPDATTEIRLYYVKVDDNTLVDPNCVN